MLKLMKQRWLPRIGAASSVATKKLKRIAILGGFATSLTLQSWVSAQDQVSTKPITGGLPVKLDPDHYVFSRTIFIRPKLAETKLSSRFFPSADQMKSGSAAPILLRMRWHPEERLQELSDLQASGQMSVPLDDLDTETIDNLFSLDLSEMTRAVYRERAGWDYPFDEAPFEDIVYPELTTIRHYTDALVLMGRSYIKKGEITSAEVMIRLAMGLSKHVGETPVAVIQLIRKVQTDNALRCIEELMQHPNASNYYWDLTSLPRPMIDMRGSIQVDSASIEKSIYQLPTIEFLTEEEEWLEAERSIWSFVLVNAPNNADMPELGTPEGEKLRRQWVRISRERLPKFAPELKERISKMSDAEVGVRYWHLRSQDCVKSYYTLALLEPHLAVPQMNADLKRLYMELHDEVLLHSVQFAFLVAAVLNAAKIDQRVAMLRTIEAIRHQSELDGGKLPKTLEGLALVVPLDPVSAQPFQYSCSPDRKSAELRSAESRLHYFGGEESEFNKHQEIYELKIVD